MKHHVIQGVVPTNDFTITLQLHLKHHAFGETILPSRRGDDLIQILRLQIGHKALSAQVDAQHGDGFAAQLTHHRQDRTVAADHDGKSAIGSNIRKLLILQILGQGLRLILGKDRADGAGKAGLLQSSDTIPGKLQIKITKRIGTESDHGDLLL